MKGNSIKGLASRNLLGPVLLFCAVLFFASPLSASESFWTIQAGTYTQASSSYAKKLFETLSTALKGDELDYLRIEKGSKYFIVRVGRFRDISGAGPLLEKVKAIVPDALIIKEDNFEDTRVVRRHDAWKPVPAVEKEIPAVPEANINKVPEPEEYYTLQIKRFSTVEEAQMGLDALAQKLGPGNADYLRVEKLGSGFYLRLGRFETYGSIQEFIRRVGEAVPIAVILKEKSSDEQIVKMYGRPSSNLIIVDKSGKPDTDIGNNSSGNPVSQGKTDSELSGFLNDVSAYFSDAQYGKAAELLSKGVEKWPDNPEINAWYGATLLNMQYPENALEHYKKAARLSPDVPNYHAGVGLSLLNIYMDRARESIDAYSKALEIDPRNVSSLEGLGFVYVSIGKTELANELYARLQSIDKAAAGRLYNAITNGVNWESRK